MCDGSVMYTGFAFCHPKTSLGVFGFAIGSVLLLGLLRAKFGGDIDE